MNQLAIEVEGVTKRFGTVEALLGVDLEAPAGQVLALLGPNGAGKTTLVRILTTLLKPDSGRVMVNGVDVVENPGLVRADIGLAGQYAAVDGNLTGRENLEMVGRLYHLGRGVARARAGELLERFDLVAAADRPSKTYSGGMRRRLDLAASLVSAPPILFLDEPTTGLDPRTRRDLWFLLRDLVAGGTTILLTTQHLEEADEMAHRIAVLDRGKKIAEGTPAELKALLGRDVIEVRFHHAGDLPRAQQALATVGVGAPSVDPDTLTVSLPAPEAARTLLAAVRRLDEAGLDPADVHLRVPSLDEVFLAMTGEGALDIGEQIGVQSPAGSVYPPIQPGSAGERPQPPSKRPLTRRATAPLAAPLAVLGLLAALWLIRKRS